MGGVFVLSQVVVVGYHLSLNYPIHESGMKKKLVILALYLLSCSSVLAQVGGTNEMRDSLRNELRVARQDSSRVLIMVDISNSYMGIDLDSEGLYGHKALALAEATGFQRGEAAALGAVGNYLQQSGDYPRSLEYLYRSLQISEQRNYPFEKAVCYNFIGNAYWFLGDHRKLIEFSNLSQNLFRTLGDSPVIQRWVTYNLLQLGDGYMELGNDSAYAYLKAFYEATSRDNYWHPPALTNLGDYLFRKGDLRNSIGLVREGVALAKFNGDKITQAEGNVVMSKIFRAEGNRDSSIFYAMNGLQASYTYKYGLGVYKNSRQLAEAFEPSDLRSALFYRKIYDSVNEAMYGARKVQELQKTLADEQRRQQIARQFMLEREARFKLYGFVGGLLIMMVVAFGLYRNILQRKKVNGILRIQKEMVETTLSDLRTTQAQLVQAEKMASLGELTAGIAHEIQNPLNFVNNFSDINRELIHEADMALDKGGGPEVKQILSDLRDNEEKISHHGRRADAIVKSMLQHSRTSSGQKEPTDLAALADEYLKLAYHGLRAKDKDFNVTLETDFAPDLPKVNVVPQDIGRVLLNLYNNAFHAVQERGKQGEIGYLPKVRVEIKSVANSQLPVANSESGTLPAGRQVRNPESVRIAVIDNGPGIPEAIRTKIFQPFFTTKPTGQGTGLGLSLSYDILRAHGGEINLGEKKGEGATFEILFDV
jgi:two-component system NtrC family sensor kinase